MTTMVIDGLFKPALMAAWQGKLRKNIRDGVEKGLNKSFTDIRSQVASDTATSFKIKKKGFEKALRRIIYKKNEKRMPEMLLISKAPWMNAHEVGKTITGKSGYLIIPLVKNRIKTSEFRKILQRLKDAKNLFFQKRGDKTLVFAKNTKDGDRYLAKFKQLERQKLGGVRTLKRGYMIPIGVMVKKITLQKRYHLTEITKSNSKRIANNIEQSIKFK